MLKAVFLVLPSTLILCTNYLALAQVGVSSGPSLALIKGDTPTAATPSCSFISTSELKPVPIVQGLLFVQRGDPPDRAEAKMGFPPDRPYANDVLQWTAIRGGNYVRAVVNFRNNSALTRSFTMATNYKQPNEKRCQWEVQEEQLGPQENLTPQPSTQNNSALPANQVNRNRIGITQNGKVVGGDVSYPRGSRINSNGVISTPRGERNLPNVSVKHGDGSTSYYYRDGSHITIDRTNIRPTGTLIR